MLFAASLPSQDNHFLVAEPLPIAAPWRNVQRIVILSLKAQPKGMMMFLSLLLNQTYGPTTEVK